jgi:cytochrome d ubiquinol oxidase subunit I
MTDFWALLGNANVWHQFPHALASGIVGAGFLVMAFSAYHLLRKKEDKTGFFYRSFRWASTYALIGSLLVATVGHFQGQFLVKHQPLKMAAAEAIWETEQPAGFSVIAWIDEENQTNSFDLKVPYALSFLSYNNFTSEVEGINDLQAAAEAQYGSGDYIPPVTLNYWSFRIMVGLGFLMLGISALGVWWSWKGKITEKTWFLRVLMPAFLFPTIASTAGWLLTETGRWPWIVYGLQRIENAVSPNVTRGNIWFSLIAFTVLYGILMVIGVGLALKYGKQDPTALEEQASA